MPHLVLDSERLAVHRLLNTRFRNRERLHNAYAEAQWKDQHAKSGDGDFVTDSIEAVMGKSLHHMELMRRLRMCNRSLYFELSTATKRFGLYYPDPEAKGTSQAPHVRYLGMTIAQGMNPEFTPKFTNERGELKSVETGYRSVLARLLRQGFITEPQIMKYFGVPSRTSQRWQSATT